MQKLTERFLRYVKTDTQSDPESTTCPSTNKQFNLALALKEELIQMGMTKVEVDENGYLYATIPSNIKAKVPAIGFIAHLDTSPDLDGANVKPNLIKEYPGGDIVLNEDENILLSPGEFPELNKYIGQDIITRNNFV